MNFRFGLFRGLAMALLAVGPALAVPQLKLTSVTPGVSSGYPGDTVTFTVTIKNIAPPPAGGPNDYGGGSSDLTLTLTSNDAAQINLGTVNVSIPTLAPDGEATVQVSRTIPLQTSQAAAYYVNASVPVAQPFFVETSIRTTAPNFTVLGKPDFEIRSFTYIAGTAYEGGQWVNMSLTWRNRESTNGYNNVPYVSSKNGNAAFSRIEVVLSSNPTFGDSDDFLLTAHTIQGTVNADDVDHLFNWSQLLPGNFAGTYYVMAKIDALNGVAEVVENDLSWNGNNIWSGQNNGTRITLLPTNFPTTYWASASGGAYSDNPSISSDGRYTAYASDSTNLVAGDTNGARDIFIYDNQTSTIRRLSLSQQGAQANAGSQTPVLSGAGGFVAFSSDATNLVLGDTNGFSDIFVVNTLTGAISRDSLSTGGGQANGSSYRPSLSSDGRYLVFESSATNLAGTATAVGVRHIYLRDRAAGTTRLISRTTDAIAGNGNSLQAMISADGAYVAFASDATNLVANDTNGTRDIFLHNVSAGTTVRVSVASGGAQANGPSRAPSISQDGGYVAFGSEASNLVAGDTNGVSDIFVYNRVAATTVRVSTASTGVEASDPSAAGFQLGSINPSISATGRYVTYASLANNLTAGDALGQVQATDANESVDIFVTDRDATGTGTFDTAGNISTLMVSKNRFGYQTAKLLGIPSTAASDLYPVISADGRWVALPSDAENTAGLVHGATNRTSPDLNTFRDVFLHDRRINALPTPSTPPVVTITYPGDGNAILVSTPVSVTASATTTVGVVSSVQFFVNGTSLGTSSVFPYSQTWTPTAVGAFTLSALVTDSFGNVGVSANVAVTVKAAPSVGITSPAGGSVLAAGTEYVLAATAAATTPGAVVDTVEFLVNGTLVAADTSAPYSVDWTPAVAGSYTITAVAIDSLGTRTTSPAVAVTASGGSGGGGVPMVTIVNPNEGGTYIAAKEILFDATALDPDGTITKVDLLANGVIVATDTNSPYFTNWSPPSPGSYTLVARATDNDGNVANSLPVRITVTQNTPASINLASPSDGATFTAGTGVIFFATALDANGTINNVRFLANGDLIGSADTAAPFTTLWTPGLAGTYTILAIAVDNDMNASTSPPRTVTIRPAVGHLPAVTITSPTANAALTTVSSVPITAGTSDPDGTVTSVKFYDNGVLIDSDTAAPFTTTWIPSRAGDHRLVAVATDDSGNIVSSAPVDLTVTAATSPTGPSISITAPAAGASLPVGTTTAFSAFASDSDGSIVNVQFFANGTVISSDATFPFATQFTPGSPGTYILTAQATDNSGNQTTSAPVVVTVDSGFPPSVSLTNTSGLPTISAGAVLNLAAVAADVDGIIQSVEFLANGTSFTTATVPPYQASWKPTAAGTYQLTARATDNGGNISSSTGILVVVIPNQVPAVKLTAPLNGATVRVGGVATIAAAATDPDGTIASVQFLANGLVVATDAVPPYTAQWTPTAEGVFRLAAVAIDNAGAVSSSATILAKASASAGDAIATGNYQGAGEVGNFAVISAAGKAATFIGFSKTVGLNRTYRYTSVPMNLAGGYSLTDEAGRSLLSGSVNETGTTGTLDNNRLTFIGVDSRFFPVSKVIATGYFSGSLTSRAGSVLSAIIGADGSIIIHVVDGDFTDAGGGGPGDRLDGSGSFSVLSMRGERFVGTANPITGLITGTLSGTNGGAFTAASTVLSQEASTKVEGGGSEVLQNVRVSLNGNTYDQVLLESASASVTADPGQITRISYVDLSNDIVQVEFSGAGRLAITLENASPPAVALNYHQPSVRYMKGHASIVITGANETTNVSVFSVGTITAVNQALFRTGVNYDGVADIGSIAILSSNGKFGGVRTANANYVAAQGVTGICAPGVEFFGPVFVGDINASGSANAMLLLGAAPDVRVTGGDLWQPNGKPVQVSGVSQLKFVDGTTSHGTILAAQEDRSRLEQDGVDVTAQIVVNPQTR